MTICYVLLGGFLGSISRFYITKKLNHRLPYGTFLVNMIGSFLLGYFIGEGYSKTTLAFLASGFCGAFTTFSTLNLESFKLYIEKRQISAIAYLLLSYIVGILLAFVGLMLGK
ncbi:fluoride efflux transporter FluC [Bacillus sp. CGMCC 1.16607]|uniref:fluoride efflux transporter FluC n=1 Tax=Bacillus sp. CGMCC 1.16607 TaxID=3351842 RepID=UPI00362E7A45